MKKVMPKAEKYLARKRRRQIWMKAVICLACVVVFLTTYALILPAITLEKPTCGKEEHLHTKECYAEAPAETQRELVCSKQALNVHAHTAACYGADGGLACGLADYVAHTHDENCYGQDEALVCTLAEVKEHAHTAACYGPGGELVCGKPQGEAHTHTPACYTDGALSCKKLEMQAHQHTENCFKITEIAAEEKILVCGLEEHTHTEECYPEKAAPEKESGDTEKAAETETEMTETETAAEAGQADPAGEAQTESGEVPQTDASEPTSETSGGAVQAGGKQARAGENGEESEPDAGNTPSSTDPIVIQPSEISITYKDEEGNWQPVAEVTLPGDAELRMQISFSGVSTPALQANGGRLTYALPDVLRGINTQGDIQGANNTSIGTMTVQGDTVMLVLNSDWLDAQGDYVQGNFYVEGRLNLSEINKQGSSGKVMIGGVNVNIDVEGDWLAKYSSLDLEKSLVNAEGKSYPVVEHTEEGDFLTYVLTATAGPDGVADAAVVDKFTSTANVVEYCGVTTASQTAGADAAVTETITSSAAAPAAGTVYYGTATAETPIPAAGSGTSKPGNLVWHIGKMEPNETRTLTYKVKLVDGYSSHRQTAKITNTASAYSGEYLRDTSTANFVPKVGYNMRKQHDRSGNLEFEPDEDGIGGTITYIIWVTANADNNYAVDTKIYDFFANNSDGIINPDYVELAEDSFKLYNGKAVSQAEAAGLTEAVGRLEKDPSYNGSYVYHMGLMEPGSARTLVYKVRIKDEVFLEAGGDFSFRNRAKIFAEGDNTGVGNSGSAMQAFSDRTMISRYNWSEKMAGEALEANTRVSFGENETVYSNGQPVSGEYLTGFTALAGSIRYVVKVNEAGTLTVNSSVMEDTLGEHLLYTGYMKVEAFEKSAAASANPYTAVDYDTQTPVRTVWMDIDNRSSFSFRPSELGFGEDAPYAYRITYYAKPDNVGKTEQFVVNNAFNLSGRVGGTYQFGGNGIRVDVSVTVTGSGRFSAWKYAWYYESPADGADADWANGALYWYIKVSGSSVPENTDLRDHPGNYHVVRNRDSLVGIYRGKLPEDASDISALKQLEQIPESDYSCTVTAPVTGHNGILDIRFLKEITLDEENEEEVYIVVKTSPNRLPTELQAVEYTNYLMGEADNGALAEVNHTSQTVLGSKGVSKSAKGVFSRDTSEWKHISGAHSVSGIDTANVTEPGIYLDWLIDVNFFGTLSGELELEDVIPEGLELTYLRIYAWGGEVSIGSISTPEIEGIEEAQKLTWPGRSSSPACTYYYDASTNRVRWKVSGLTVQKPVDQYPSNAPYNHKTIEFQIVCRVTDPDVLLGDEERYFDNTIIGIKDGQEIGRDSDGMTVHRTPASLDKAGGLAAATKTGRIPFSIKVNPLGEDLAPGSSQVMLVDELSDSLRIDLTTLQVRGGVDDEPEHLDILPVDSYTPKLDGNVFSIALPDSMPLTVTYEAVVEAVPGTPVSISNSAHWEGYEASVSSEVEQQNFSYQITAQMESQAAQFTLRKVDAANLNYPLQGAEFKIQKYEVTRNADGVFLGGPVAETLETGTTDHVGTLIFIEEGQQYGYLDIEYDTVYGVTETKAPDGYVPNEETHYFVVAKEIDSTTHQYLAYPQGVHVQYAGVSSEYNYVAQNAKGVIEVTKAFKDAEGKETNKPVPGSYTFGIYETSSAEMPTGDPLQRLTVTYAADGTVTCLRDNIPATTMTFKNLDLMKAYAVYELDADGTPVPESGSMWLDSKQFKVSYGINTGITFDQDGKPSSAAAVSNTVVAAYELPESGGPGIAAYILGGIAIMAGALIYDILRRRRGAL